MAEKVKVRVLLEQRAYGDREYLASGEEYSLEKEWARELLDRGDAEAVASTPAKRAERRPRGGKSAETR